jgi:hypothetical protein
VGLASSWKDLAERVQDYLVEVPSESIVFDPNGRRTIDTRIIDELKGSAGGVRPGRNNNGMHPTANQPAFDQELVWP